jgi:SAM-dependent methyltransferase
MLGHHTDRDWQTLGELDPCWAVLTGEPYRGADLADAETLEAVLDSGRRHVDRVWDVIETHLGGPFTPHRALDFGSGVGRVAIPLAERCGSVVGVEVAESMLATARAVSGRLGLANVRFVKSDDALGEVAGTFDLIHSYIVFQHIPPSRGLRLIRLLLDKLTEGGVGVIHVLYHNPDLASFPANVAKRVWRWLRRPFRRVPQMQMNAYPLNEVFRLVQESGGRRVHVLPTDHGGCLGLVICFRNAPNDSYLV